MLFSNLVMCNDIFVKILDFVNAKKILMNGVYIVNNFDYGARNLLVICLQIFKRLTC